MNRNSVSALGLERAARGFSLVELLVGMSLALMVMTAILSSYTYMGRSLARLVNQQSLQSEARRALAYFAQDVRMASGLTDTANLSATRVSLTLPTGTGTNTITYYYNSTAISGSTTSDAVTVNGTSVSMSREALTRCVYDGTTVTSLTLVKNITSSGFTFAYYDATGNTYTSYTNYLPGIKQLSFSYTVQKGDSFNGTQTLVQQFASPRLILRNRQFLL
ncbi:MAG: prepilin-type N-terminal cleavage/methylation domain-containing protein [Lacunisphaera sp.]|nr:prepilin-type N-terminal cleavage/methylation domain-containing protein [Lacunisphaera sp.]